MDIFKKYNIKPLSLLKIAGLALAAIVVLAVAIRLLAPAFNQLTGGRLATKSISQSALGIGGAGLNYAAPMAESADMGLGLSVRNVATATDSSIIPPTPTPGGTTGDDAEDYEVTSYQATIETRDLDDTCGSISALKAKDYVIFEQANEYDQSCRYVFKVKVDKADEVLSVIQDLDPRDLVKNTQTIKKLIEDFTSQLDILEKKSESIEETLDDALEAYDEISGLARRTGNADSLASVIDSKIKILERLTNERINVNAQIERLSRTKAQQLDRLKYTYFSVYVYETKFIDGEELADSWKAAVKEFVEDVNVVLQDISVRLVALLFLLLQYAIYLLLVVVIAKYGWKLVKKIWKA
jgi:hypothetical protein